MIPSVGWVKYEVLLFTVCAIFGTVMCFLYLLLFSVVFLHYFCCFLACLFVCLLFLFFFCSVLLSVVYLMYFEYWVVGLYDVVAHVSVVSV
jgi:hypothetical protein